jgi:hypothetical protein
MFLPPHPVVRRRCPYPALTHPCALTQLHRWNGVLQEHAWDTIATCSKKCPSGMCSDGWQVCCVLLASRLTGPLWLVLCTLIKRLQQVWRWSWDRWAWAAQNLVLLTKASVEWPGRRDLATSGGAHAGGATSAGTQAGWAAHRRWAARAAWVLSWERFGVWFLDLEEGAKGFVANWHKLVGGLNCEASTRGWIGIRRPKIDACTIARLLWLHISRCKSSYKLINYSNCGKIDCAIRLYKCT